MTALLQLDAAVTRLALRRFGPFDAAVVPTRRRLLATAIH